MELLNLILTILIASLALYQIYSLSKLRNKTYETTSLLNNLKYRQKASTDYFEKHIARIHYDLLKRSGKLIFYPEMGLQDALNRPGVRKFLIKIKMIRKKDEGPFKETLAQCARKSNLSIEPILIALNDLEID